MYRGAGRRVKGNKGKKGGAIIAAEAEFLKYAVGCHIQRQRLCLRGLFALQVLANFQNSNTRNSCLQFLHPNLQLLLPSPWYI